MISIQERVPLAPYTTLGVGGSARFFALAKSEAELAEALSYAREHALPLAILGGGSNTLVPDTEIEGLVIVVAIPGVEFVEAEGGVEVIAGAGVSWDALVREAGARGLWGIENLASVPGTVGGAAVQNIGAYGGELSTTFAWAETLSIATGEKRRVDKAEAAFAYRDSVFKQTRASVVTKVALRLSSTPHPHLSYPDLAKAAERGEPLTTPTEIAEAVRRIRAKKFPTDGGTAGSFFKNPVIDASIAEAFKAKYPELPMFPQPSGKVKVSLAWILDHVLQLRGYAKGPVRLFERQPLAIVASQGARAADVEALADEVASRVYGATGITLEREVETLYTHRV